jgi:hypothetical protein
MKIFLSILLVFGSFYESNGQTINNGLVKPLTKPFIIFSDTSLLKKSNYQMVQLNNPLMLVGKNGNGFDIYQSKVDNMYILRPDSANKAAYNMPNAIAPPLRIK